MKNLWIFDKRRLEILRALMKCSDTVCGCDLRGNLKMSRPLLSYHTAILLKKGMLEEKKCGRQKEYRIRPDKMALAKKILTIVEE